jgi:hypothetical protein
MIPTFSLASYGRGPLLARLKAPQTKHHFEDSKIYSYNLSPKFTQ